MLHFFFKKKTLRFFPQTIRIDRVITAKLFWLKVLAAMLAPNVKTYSGYVVQDLIC